MGAAVGANVGANVGAKVGAKVGFWGLGTKARHQGSVSRLGTKCLRFRTKAW